MPEIKPNHIKKFQKLAQEMDGLMCEICKYNPDANLYIEGSGHAILMKGPSHTNDRYGMPLFENAVTTVDIHQASGGGW